MSDRFGFNAPGDRPIEEAIRWGADHGFCTLDFQADHPPNAIASFDDARVERVRDLCAATGVEIGIHPSSAVNTAEHMPTVPT